MIAWLIGLSGSGKTTLAEATLAELRRTHVNVVHVDGDVIREVFGNDLGHSLSDRRRNAERIMRLCLWLEAEGQIVVCSILSLFPQHRTVMRDRAQAYLEVYIEAPLDQLRARDGKGLYARFDAGEIREVAGLDLDFPAPTAPDMHIFNNGPVAALLAQAQPLARRMSPS